MPKLDAITITVADTERSLAFYRLLGLSVPPRGSSGSYATADQPAGVRVEWTATTAEPDVVANRRPCMHTGRMGIAVRCEDTAEVDATHRALVDAGYESDREPRDAPWGSRHSCVLDPDGNPIDLFAPLP